MPPGGSTGEADGEEEASRCSSFPIDAAASGPDAWGPGSCGCGVGGGPCDDMPGVGSAAAAAAAAATGGGGGELSGDVPISAAVVLLLALLLAGAVEVEVEEPQLNTSGGLQQQCQRHHEAALAVAQLGSDSVATPRKQLVLPLKA
eukprot:CAMPEP_0206479028 /NCGR_PEP_ID=MMETSP0324_2-20121206/36437_1 /ASSEMBLY_ACC=CAM_ASM_000836 /TAXON_ID=2866 /ORGANISM="Crypthecodinium cohnii, Strain Seligo" /LENGTH=145 /DNA_ID=CAMNT_0053955511 /DNA_START=94 /DNA_END=528 /DNA_ORIENTATION=+